MKQTGRSILWIIGISVILTMGSSGCATRRYVRKQVKPVDQRVTDLDTKTSEQIAALSNKEQADVSRLDERINSTDSQVAQVAGVAQQASLSADRANQLGEANRIEMRTHTVHEVKVMSPSTSYDPGNLQLIDKGDVTFQLNKSRLDKQAQAELDMIAQKAKSTPRAVISLEGFADKTGGSEHNLRLSRQRADAVARYLVKQNVPLTSINMIGLGEENPSSALASDFPIPGSVATRRVYIRLYAPKTGEAARSEP
jgi:OOP family OmpA-OmpF porin